MFNPDYGDREVQDVLYGAVTGDHNIRMRWEWVLCVKKIYDELG